MLAAALQAALAFNLACTGTELAGPLGLSRPDQVPARFAVTYRVDLDLRRWCSDECERTEELGDVLFTHILLRDRSSPSGRHVIDFDPATGRCSARAPARARPFRASRTRSPDGTSLRPGVETRPQSG